MIHFISSLSTPEFIALFTIGLIACIYCAIRYKGWRWCSFLLMALCLIQITNRLVQTNKQLNYLHFFADTFAFILNAICIIAILVGCCIVKYKKTKSPNNSDNNNR